MGGAELTVKMDVDLKSKNPVEVKHFHNVQVQLNVPRTCTPKAIERGIKEDTK